jgi:uncharacterized OB-fold protein
MPDLARPLPLIDDGTRFFWEGTKEGKLLIQRCASCQLYVHPPSELCPRCRSWDLQPTEVSGRGHVYTFTVARQAFHPYFADKLPYVIVAVTLEEQDGLRVISSLVDCEPEDATVGMPVRVRFTPVDGDVVLPFFQPEVASP